MTFKASSKACLTFITLAAAIATGPLFEAGLYSGHDPVFRDHIRLQEFAEGLRAGQFLPRWQDNFYYGYGYPFFNFYQPLFYYAGSIFYFSGISIQDSLKSVIFLAMAGSGISMFLCARYFWGMSGALLSSVCYMFAPYHLADLYVRTSLAEFMSFVFFPLAFLSLIKLTEDVRGAIPGFAMSLAGLILSHNAEALIFSGLLMLFLIVRLIRGCSIPIFVKTVFAWMLGLALASFFWLPALNDRQFVHIDRMKSAGYNLFIHFLLPSQLIEQIWGYEASGLGYEAFPFSPGIVTLTCSVMGIAVAWKKISRLKVWIGSLIAGFFILCFLMLEISAPLWHIFPSMQIIQFPWRMMAPLSFISSLLLGSISFAMAFHKKQFMVMILLSCALMTSVIPGIDGKRRQFIADQDLAAGTIRLNGVTTTASNEYLPLSAKEKLLLLNSKGESIQNHEIQTAARRKYPSEMEWVTGSGLASEVKKKPGEIEFDVTSLSVAKLQINTLYFPGWAVYINGIRSDIDIMKSGLMAIELHPGSNQIRCVFEETPIRRIARIISCVAAGICLALILLRLKSGPVHQ